MINDYTWDFYLDARDDARAEWADADPCQCDGAAGAPTWELCEWCEAEGREEAAAEVAEAAAARFAAYEASRV